MTTTPPAPLPHSDDLCTPWGALFDEVPLPEHPDPMFERPRWQSLNGVWNHAIRRAEDPRPSEDEWEGTIRVPFAIESAASGVQRELTPTDVLHYQRRVEIPKDWRGQRIRIVFLAVDHRCEVRVDGQVRARHTGGYLPFTATVVDTEQESFDLHVRVTDPTDSEGIQRGKQALLPQTIWYTATSGIWGSVWMEPIPDAAIESVDIRPADTLDAFHVHVRGEDGLDAEEYELDIEAPDGSRSTVRGHTGQWTRVPVSDALTWSPEHPNLYRFTVRAGDDRVSTWSALRTVSMSDRRRRRLPLRLQTRRQHDKRTPYVLLNDEPVFVNAPLSQGYWPESGMTPPDDEAIVHDLRTIKEMGFNAVRVHIKVESRRFYHHCDRLGLMVVQDMVSGGRPALGIQASGVVQALDYTLPDRSRLFHDWTGRTSHDNRSQFACELAGMIRHLRCHPSIIMWVPFNEGWGQFDARRAEKAVRRLDPTRLVDAASGWFDQGGGDFRSRHRYVLRLTEPPSVDTRAFYLSEFGGLNLAVEGHTWKEPIPFGYRFLAEREDLAQAMTELYREQLIPLTAHGLAACTYTQVSDVERENNGLMTYDRKVTKIDPQLMSTLNKELTDAFARAIAKRRPTKGR
ncbi:glycoside hydrolase family 2 [Schaalia sp. 19OD2882]|uniref:glycoside hydrolase family 2 protein n=1 Tax=Schaalia sp. 19OD2882 TaxID=2794089 RepID=UPI001C1F1DB4|nr:glycoside hydrolase family 2 TIM barrel-domain containing protein [Schaalia sp. 19OD2882]QWW18671.1 glycoside hydrolase family 2 [Schaalia sp. 19OD2882]